MDPISLIVTALIAGAQETAGTAVKDAYSALKSLIMRRFGRDDAPEFERPEAERDRIAAQLRAAGVDRDEELVRAAQALLAKVDPGGARSGKYQVQISGGKGFVVGDDATVTMNFNDE